MKKNWKRAFAIATPIIAILAAILFTAQSGGLCLPALGEDPCACSDTCTKLNIWGTEYTCDPDLTTPTTYCNGVETHVNPYNCNSPECECDSNVQYQNECPGTCVSCDFDTSEENYGWVCGEPLDCGFNVYKEVNPTSCTCECVDIATECGTKCCPPNTQCSGQNNENCGSCLSGFSRCQSPLNSEKYGCIQDQDECSPHCSCPDANETCTYDALDDIYTCEAFSDCGGESCLEGEICQMEDAPADCPYATQCSSSQNQGNSCAADPDCTCTTNTSGLLFCGKPQYTCVPAPTYP